MRIHRCGRDTFVRLPLPGDSEFIAANMREADRKEVWAASHITPEKAMATSIKNSPYVFTIIHKDEPAAMFGGARMTLLGDGIPWLLGTDAILDAAIPFLRHSRQYVDFLLGRLGRLENYVDERNSVSIRWLTFCGFTLHDPAPYGAEQLPFIRFTKEV